MKIKKSVLDGSDNLEIWNNLVDHYLPDFDETNRLQLDNVSLTFSLLTGLHYEIMNGGIVQFIDNGSGNYFHETLDAARRINFTDLVQILEKAAEKFPNGEVPTDWDYRRQVWDEIGEQHITKGEEYDIVDADWEKFWEDLDKAYYSVEPTLYKLTIDYLKSNATFV